jgi:hypothetical protein
MVIPVAARGGSSTALAATGIVQNITARLFMASKRQLPHASLRRPLVVPEPTNGAGSAKVWRPCTPAMAAGLTDHVWSLQEVLLYRVPPWPQPQVR